MSARGRVAVDDSRWLRVYVVWPPEPLEDAEFEGAVLAMSALLKRREPYVIIRDARRAVRPTPKQRAFAAEQQKRDAEGTRRLLRGVALLGTFSSLDAVEAWAGEQLAQQRG